MASYDQARADFEALERLAELDDQVELDALRVDLMRNPTKAFAAEMYETGIRLWLDQHRVYFGSHPDVQAIAERR
jgi:hypothetical protein